MPEKSNKLFRFWEELNRRSVVRIVLIYLAAAYAILESSDMILPRLGLADWTVDMVMIILFVGLVLVIILSWVYDITPGGIKVTDIENGRSEFPDISKLEGTKIANYQTTKKLGESSLGVIYRAKDTALKRKVTLTFLSDWICSDKVVQARLIEKIQAAAGVIVENRSTIYSVEKERGVLFIVMEEEDEQSSFNNIPVELQAIIIEAIKDEPVKKEDVESIAESVYQAEHKSEIELHSEYQAEDKRIVKTRKHFKLPEIVTSKKMTLPAILVVILLIIGFNWSGIGEILGLRDSKREEAVEYLKNGKEQFLLGNYEEAKVEFEFAVKVDEDYSDAWSNLAAACINLNDLSSAIMHTIEAIELDESNYRAAYNLAYALDERMDYIQAIEWYRKAIDLEKSFLPSYSALGRVYNLSGRPVEAIVILNKALNKFPDSDSLYLVQKNIGYSYFLMDQIDESINYLNQSFEVQPDELETVFYLAQSYEAAKEITRSLEFWEKYIEMETDSLKVTEARLNLRRITAQYLDELNQE